MNLVRSRLIIALEFAFFAFGCGPRSDRATLAVAEFKPLAVGDTVATFTGTSLDGKPIVVGAGQPLTLVNVWATWCTSCREELSDLGSVARELDGKGVRVVGVSVDEAPDDRVRKFVEDNGITFTIVHDRTAGIEQLYRTVGVPETYLISRDGVLRWHHVGNLHPVIDDARNAIQASIARR